MLTKVGRFREAENSVRKSISYQKPFMTSSQMRSDIPGVYEPQCRRWNPLPQEPAPPPGIRRAWSSGALQPRRHRTSYARCPPSPRSRSLPCRPPTSPRLCARDQAHSAFPEKCGISPSLDTRLPKTRRCAATADTKGRQAASLKCRTSAATQNWLGWFRKFGRFGKFGWG